MVKTGTAVNNPSLPQPHIAWLTTATPEDLLFHLAAAGSALMCPYIRKLEQKFPIGD